MFHVGQKVVCVDAKPRRGGWIHEGLVEGRVYVIAAFGECASDGSIGPVFDFNPGWPYLPGRFRPVVERKTDISIFTKMLNPANRKEYAR